MNKIYKKNNIVKFIVSVLLLFSFLYIASLFYEKDIKKVNILNEVEKSTIASSNEKYTIKINYPRFKDNNLNEIITNYIYSYTKTFKESDIKPKSLFIDYELYYIDNFVNIVFNIDNSLTKDKYSNIILDIRNNKLARITDIYDKDTIVEKLLSQVYYKYTNSIYNIIKNENINNFTYILSDSKIVVYFDKLNFGNIIYTPYIDIPLMETETVFEENDYPEGAKFVAFTFDDGPSDYTLDTLKTLELNESSATFFMLGNKMKYNSDIILKIYNSNSEVGSHTYSHKYLIKLNDIDLDTEFNSTSIIFNEITGGNINYLRPPYGIYNDKVIEKSPYPLILWNVDPKDWLSRDSNEIYENIINNVCDGCIVLLHDTYKETIDALKITLPILKEKGYEVVSISKLLKAKNIELKRGDILKKID